MYNELLAIAQVDVTVGITATIGNNECSLDISITFRFNVFIFEGIPSGYEYNENQYRPEYKIDVDSFVLNKTCELKQAFDEWRAYLEKHQTRVGTKIFGTMEELTEDLKTVCIEQIRVQQEIEHIIKESYERLQETSSTEDKEKLLKLISNCYQLIRDLSVSFHFGGQILELNAEISPEAEDIRKNILKKYKNDKNMPLYIKRKETSEKIIDCNNRISDINANVLEYQNSIDEINGSKKYDLWLCEQKKKSKNIFDEFFAKWDSKNKEAQSKDIAIIEESIEQINKEINLLKEKRNLFNRKKTDCTIEEFEGILAKTMERKENLTKKISENKILTLQANLEKELQREEDNLNNQYKNLEGIESSLVKEKDKLEAVRKERDDLVAEYEQIAIKIEKC